MLVKQNSVNFLKIAIKNFLTPTLVVGVNLYNTLAAAKNKKERKIKLNEK